MNNHERTAIRKLLAQITDAEDKVSSLTTKLWKLVNPTSDEQEEFVDAFCAHNDESPTDLEVLRGVLEGRK